MTPAMLAHVKWFSDFSYTDPPLPLAEALTPTLLALALLSMIVIGALVWLDVRLAGVAAYRQVNDWLAARCDRSTLVMRVGAGATLLLAWQAGTMLVPELQVGPVIGWLQFTLALLLLFRATTPLAGIGLLGLFVYGVWEVGALHMLDYTLFAGVGYYLAVANARSGRVRGSGLPALYLAVGFSLCWVALEKIVYPQWGLYILQQNPQLALGLPLDFFLRAAAFVEFALGYLLIINLLQRPMALLITLVFFTTTLVFGKLEVIGHTIIHAALIVFLLEGPGTTFRPPIAFHRRLPLRTAFASVNFALLFAALFAAYQVAAMRRYRAATDAAAAPSLRAAPAVPAAFASLTGDSPVSTDPLDRFRWKKRPLLVFAPTADDAWFAEQTRRVERECAGFAERDMALLEIVAAGPSRAAGEPLSDSDAAALRRRFNVSTDVFTTVLVGKDGTEKGRWTEPVELKAVFALIDAMPMRRREGREREG